MPSVMPVIAIPRVSALTGSVIIGGSSFVCDDAIPFPAVLGSLAMLAAIRHASSRSVPIHNVFGLLRKDGVKGEFALIGRIGFNCYGHICDL